MKYLFLSFILFYSSLSFGQYYPRGVSLNDGYLPNLDVPNKWIFGVDGIVDWQKEGDGTTNTSNQVTRGNINLQYGGQIFRGGLQIIHDYSQSVKDLSIGFGMTYNRPLFLEFGAGYLQRLLPLDTYDGWSYSLKAGYYANWIMDIKYRFRIRMSLVYNYKKLKAPTSDIRVQHFYPLLGLEFET